MPTPQDIPATDLEQETSSTLDGSEQFVMFDSTKGKRASVGDIAKYAVGDKTQLQTTDKSSVVGAINEVNGKAADLKEDLIPYPVSPDSKYGDNGQLLRTKGNGNTEWVDEGLPTDEQTAQAVSDWLDAHPEATTTVQDNAITRQKINSGFAPEIINGSYTVTDISNDLGAKVNAAFVLNDVVVIPQGNYTLEQKINVPEGKTLISHGDIEYYGNDAAIELNSVSFCKVFVNKVVARNGSCIKLKATDNVQCQFHEIHSKWLEGNIGIEFQNDATTNKGIQYINVYSVYVMASSKCVSFTSLGAQNGGWIGEIKFYGGEFVGSSATAFYSVGDLSALRVFGVSMESLQNVLDLNNASEVTFVGCRNERAGRYIFKGICDCINIIGDYYSPGAVDISGLTSTNGMTFIGTIYDSGWGVAGTEMFISPDFKVNIIGPMNILKAFRMYTSSDNIIGGDDSFPRIARLVTADATYFLGSNFGLNGHTEIIIYAEKSNVTLKNSDGTKTLFVATDNQSAWRITAASGNSYFSPSGFLVERITPYMQS